MRCVVLGVMGCGAAACVWERGGMLPGGGVLDTVSLSAHISGHASMVTEDQKSHRVTMVSAREWESLPNWLKSVGREAVINAVVSEMEAHADGPNFPTSGYRTCGMAKDAIGKALGINLMPADREGNARVHNYVQGLMNSWTTQQRHGNE